MTKSWSTSDTGTYELTIDGAVQATMQLERGTRERKAVCTVGDRTLILTKTGLWRSNVEVRDQEGNLLGVLKPEKWYASSWILEYTGEEYTMRVRNNPLAEWVFSKDGVDILAYGLNVSDGALHVRITTTTDQQDPILDLLLWYFFVPVATENMGDTFTFLTLMNAV